MKYVWERESGLLQFEPNQRVVLYFRGSCSPATKGHFAAVNDLLEANKHHKHIRVVIDQVAFVNRHGVPKSTARNMWQKFIDHLLPHQDVFLSDGTFLHDSDRLRKYLDQTDVWVFVRGDEDADKHKLANHFEHGHRHTLDKLRNHKIDVIYFGGQRTKVSATRFVEALIRGRHDKQAAHRIIKEFLPDGLPHRVAHDLLRSLWDCYLQA